NRSWNHGHECEWPIDPAAGTDPKREEREAARRCTARAVLATLLLASVTPMRTAGDEVDRTQRGHNNADCQSNAITLMYSLFDLPALEQRETVRRLLQLRGAHPQLRCPHFLRPADAEALDAGQVAWFGADGRGLSHEDWMDPSQHLLVMLRPAIPGRE